jgi:hypothetical protein
MADGHVMPGKHDGMAAFGDGAGRVRLVRNHETDRGTPFSRAAYDPQASGGTTTLVFDTEQGRFISSHHVPAYLGCILCRCNQFVFS